MKNEPVNPFGELTAPDEVRFVRLLPGPIERVWAYLTEPEKRATWFAGGPMELRIGGRVELKFRHSQLAPDETPPEEYRQYHEPGDTMVATITQLDAPRLLAYTWEGATPQEISEVIFQLESHGSEVRLVLTHRRLARPEQVADVGGGWHLHLAYLAARLHGAPPPPFWPTHAQLAPEYRRRVEAQFAPK